MMTCRHHTLAVVSIGATTLAIAACGSKAPQPVAAPTPAPPAVAVPAPPAAPAAPTLPPLTIAAALDAKVKASMTMAASTDVNPNDEDRPSPIVVRVYQLRTDGAFTRAAFVPLYDDEQKALGHELISRDEYVLTPGEQKTIDVTLSGEARFVGALAAFQKISNAQWRTLLPTPRKGLSLAVERARIVLSATE